MEELQKKRADRFRVLYALYQYTGGNLLRWVDLRGLCPQQKQIAVVYHYLLNEGLIQAYGSGFTAYITHKGVVMVENALESPAEETVYFPACNRIDLVAGGEDAELV
jgi:hypothetical protein